MSIIIPANSAVGGGFDVANSIRFDDGSSSYLQKSASGGNRRTFTFSTWVKRSTLGGGASGYNTFFSSDQATANSFRLTFSSNGSDDKIMTYFYTGSQQMQLITNRLFRDTSAWYHIVVAVDTTQGTASNRTKLYVNGVQETSFSTETYPSQNLEMSVNQSGAPNRVGAGTSLYFDGYMAETVLLDGTAASPTSFGEFDEDSGVWKAIDVSGLTFGTNGFHLNYETAAELGTDANGGTTLSETNLTALDQSTDTCTNNFATLNFVAKGSGTTFADGNLKATTTISNYNTSIGSIGLTQGKWYWEMKLGSGLNYSMYGITTDSPKQVGNIPAEQTKWTYVKIAYGTDLRYNESEGTGYQASSYGNANSGNDIVMIALDLDNNFIYMGAGGTWYNSGNPTSGASGSGAAPRALVAGNTYFPAFTTSYGTNMEINFGSPSYAISSGNQDGNGYGNFEYAVPSGYFSLNTKNLSEVLS